MQYTISGTKLRSKIQNDRYSLKIDLSCVNDVPAGILNFLDVGYTYTRIDLNQFRDLIYHLNREELSKISDLLIIIGASSEGLSFEFLTLTLNYIDSLSEVMHRKGVRGQCHIVMETGSDPITQKQ